MGIYNFVSKLMAGTFAAIAIGTAAQAATVGSATIAGEFSTTSNTVDGGGSYSLSLDQALFSTLTPTTPLIWEYGLVGSSNIPGFTAPNINGTVTSSANDLIPALIADLGLSGIVDLNAVQSVASGLLANSSLFLSQIMNNASSAVPLSVAGYIGVLNYGFSDFDDTGGVYSGNYNFQFVDNDPNANYDFWFGAFEADLTVSTIMLNPDPDPNPTPNPGPTPNPIPLPASLPLLGAGLAAMWTVRRRKRA